MYPFRMMGEAGQSTNIFNAIFEEMTKDPEIVERFKGIAKAKLDESIPEAANKMAGKICEQVAEGHYDHPMRDDLRTQVKTRLQAYYTSPEGSANLDEKIRRAIEKSMEGTVVAEVVRNYVSAEIGQLAQNAVAKALLNQKAKENRAAKKAAKK